MKKYVTFGLLAAFMVVAGWAVQHYCFRFPTEAELKRFHEAKQSTSVNSLTSELVVNDEDQEVMRFRLEHSNNSGFEEAYNLDAPRRWVMPWNDYQWMLNK